MLFLFVLFDSQVKFRCFAVVKVHHKTLRFFRTLHQEPSEKRCVIQGLCLQINLETILVFFACNEFHIVSLRRLCILCIPLFFSGIGLLFLLKRFFHFEPLIFSLTLRSTSCNHYPRRSSPPVSWRIISQSISPSFELRFPETQFLI